jgi:hypothetical protein
MLPWGCGAPREAAPPDDPGSQTTDVMVLPSEEPIPQFPWPPPRASATAALSCARIAQGPGQHNLADIDTRLSEALESNGYTEKSYFSVPAGFAMVTRIEQTEEDGTSKAPPVRWSVDVGALQEFSLNAYLRALFKANPGFYRLIVFVVTSKPFAQKKTGVERDEAMSWLAEGANTLPSSIGNLPLTGRHSCTALIYEFEQPGAGKAAALKQPGRLPGRTHLEKAKLWNAMGGGR